MKAGITRTLLCIFLAFIATITTTQVTKAQEIAIVAVDKDITVGISQTFDVNITITNVENLYLWCLNFSWNPRVLNLTNYAEGPFVQKGGPTVFFAIEVNHSTGVLGGLMCCLLGDVPGVGGSGTLAILTFNVTSVGTSIIDIGEEDGFWNVLLDSDGDFLSYSDQDGTVTVVSERKLSIKVSGELDYQHLEDVNIRVAALVTDANTLEPVSDANVAIRIYDPEGDLWISDHMTERVEGTGIYEWESNKTVAEISKKGVYLVHAQASFEGEPTASDILEFHIDPPDEKDFHIDSSDEKDFVPRIIIGQLSLLVATAVAAVAAVIYIVKKQNSDKPTFSNTYNNREQCTRISSFA